jgi:class 3 adenylate cyclase
MPLPKLKLSFRTKLIVAMSVIVVGVTGATVLVTERRVQETYRRLFEEQFRGQIGYFYEKQAMRLATVTAKCRELAASERLIAGLEKAEAQPIYENVFNELRDLLRSLGGPGGPGGGPGGTNTLDPFGAVRREFVREMAAGLSTRGEVGGPGGPGAVPGGAGGPGGRRSFGGPGGSPGGPPGGPRRFEMPMIRVVDANGEPFQTTDPRAGLIGRVPRVQTEAMRAFMARVSGTNILDQQEVGYLALENEEGRVHLREFVVTPILKPGARQALGALVLGFPFSDLGEQFLFDFTKSSSSGQIIGGIWLDGQIHSQTIPEAVRAQVAALVGRLVTGGLEANDAGDDLRIQIAGTPHRVFHKVLNPGSSFPPAVQVCLYSLAAVQAEQRDLRLRIGGFGLVALVGALGIILLISHGLTVPIRELVRGTGEIRRGNFEVKVPVRSGDEIGELATSFNEMATGLALNRRYQAVLAQVADKEVAEALMRGDVALGGETRQVSVLFCDIRGFTALTQSLPPAEVIELLNEHMTALTRVVYEHHGVVDKFVGDLIMALFGAPKSYEQDTLNAARCAVRMMEERRRLNGQARRQVDIGIGLATGEVVAGCMGSLDRLNYTVLGDRVNLAARLCSHAARGEIIIDQATADALDGALAVEPLPPLLLKGFSGPVQACRLAATASQHAG